MTSPAGNALETVVLGPYVKAAKDGIEAGKKLASNIGKKDEPVSVEDKDDGYESPAIGNVTHEDLRNSDIDTTPPTEREQFREIASEKSDKKSGDTGLGAYEFGGKSVDEMRDMMNEDPDALMEHLDGLSDEKRQQAMQYMNQRMQQINQMFSMMSNMQKAQHDTAKAAINNMRV